MSLKNFEEEEEMEGAEGGHQESYSLSLIKHLLCGGIGYMGIRRIDMGSGPIDF